MDRPQAPPGKRQRSLRRGPCARPLGDGSPARSVRNSSRRQPGRQGVFCVKNVLIRSSEYDYHTLVKVAEMAGLAGIIGFHPAGDDYLLTFPDGADTDEIIGDYKRRLRDLENNIWSH